MLRGADITGKDLALYGGLALLAYIVLQGGVGSAAKAAGAAVVDAATGATVGVVGAIGEAVGLPLPEDLTTDPMVARWIIDSPDGGYGLASVWSSAGAFAQSLALPRGSGQPPPEGTKIAMRFRYKPYTGGASGGW